MQKVISATKMQAKHTEYSSKADVNSAITSWYSSCAEREPTSCGVSQPSMQQQDVTDWLQSQK